MTPQTDATNAERAGENSLFIVLEPTGLNRAVAQVLVAGNVVTEALEGADAYAGETNELKLKKDAAVRARLADSGDVGL
jgi:hypothetical protein